MSSRPAVTIDATISSPLRLPFGAINYVLPAIGQFPHAVALLVAGYFNVDLVAPKGNRVREEIAAGALANGRGNVVDV